MNFNTNKTLNDLEDDTFDNIDFQSGLVQKCQRLRNKKLKEFTVEDLRVMIGQKISLNYLVPLALEVLSPNPFVEGELYIGDLLEQVMRVDKEFWNANKDLSYELDEIIVEVKSSLDLILPIIKNYQSPY